MALANTLSAVVLGVGARVVNVEANIGPGLPGTYIVGLGDAAVTEARDRLKTAAQNARLGWPKTKVMINLSPASLRKHGTMMDLAMCMAVLAAQDSAMDIAHVMFLGEVGLDGRITAVPGVVPAILAGAREGLGLAVVPEANAPEAASAAPSGFTVLSARHILDVVQWAAGQVELPAASSNGPRIRRASSISNEPDMRDVIGQPEAKRAAEVAAAGGHHFMILGPPGSGKSMIARRFAGILPDLDEDARRECQSIASVTASDWHRIPFVAPHHSVSKAALIGGGSGRPTPGAVTKAHHGVLFLDEVSEIPAPVLDALRIPLDQGKVELIRADGNTTFPARFQLVLAANACRCGAAESSDCQCSARQRASYLHNLSGPLWDRIDILVHTHPKGKLHDDAGESSNTIADRVAEARCRTQHRLAQMGIAVSSNAAVPAGRLRRELPATPDAMALLESYLAVGALSQRAVDKTLRLGWSIADLAAAQQPNIDHIAQALEYCGNAKGVLV
ncbi:YifB family Mg chelatase-like AAA ATPase [Corynebacterium gerontici]|uniref:Competence protein ComM n=1 Tax=Corynebacterium gerontici TaxID=2079234 RepID=A0A3G6J141_9CORY|nr:YifB family Mg chelatase-like AAA ATPase [Corynebacterium gerontici]AZA11687.1 Competence protein ComM [Corynebacterium gerontici]